jgi:hypothetical protein
MAKNHGNQGKSQKNHRRYAVVTINHPDPQVTYNCQIPDQVETGLAKSRAWVRLLLPPPPTHLGQTAEWCINVPDGPDQTTLKSYAYIALLRNSQEDEKTHPIRGHFYFAFILYL